MKCCCLYLSSFGMWYLHAVAALPLCTSTWAHCRCARGEPLVYLVNSFSSLLASDVCFAPPDFECDFWVKLISQSLLPRQLRPPIYAGVSWQHHVQHADGQKSRILIDNINREWGYCVIWIAWRGWFVGHILKNMKHPRMSFLIL